MLNPFGVIRPSQIGLPASSINWQQHPEQSCHAIKPPRALTPITLLIVSFPSATTAMPSTKAQGKSTATAATGPKHDPSTTACESTCGNCHREDTKPRALEDSNLPEDLRYTMRRYLSQDPSAEPWQSPRLKARFSARI